jgi:hypothetical protein
VNFNAEVSVYTSEYKRLGQFMADKHFVYTLDYSGVDWKTAPGAVAVFNHFMELYLMTATHPNLTWAATQTLPFNR